MQIESVPGNLCKRSRKPAWDTDFSRIGCCAFNHCSAVSSARTIHRPSAARRGARDRCSPCRRCYALHDGADLVAEVGEKSQGVAGLVGDARDQSGDQDLARNHFPFNSSILRSPFGRGRMNERNPPRNAAGFRNVFRSVREMRAAGELRARFTSPRCDRADRTAP